MAMLATSTALLGLMKLIKAILPGTKYATNIWVQDKLIPTLNSFASQIEELHSYVASNQMVDNTTRVILSVLVAILSLDLRH